MREPTPGGDQQTGQQTGQWAGRNATSAAELPDVSQEVCTGQVVERLGENRVRVQVAATSSGCARCAAGRGCGLGLMPRSPTYLVCEVRGLALEVGSAVALDTHDSASLRLRVIALAYGLPLGGLVLGVASAAAIGAVGVVPGGVTADALAALGGVIGLAGGVFAWTRLAPRLANLLAVPTVSGIPSHEPV